MNLRALCTSPSAGHAAVLAIACTALTACASVEARPPAGPVVTSPADGGTAAAPTTAWRDDGSPGTESPWEVTLGGSGVSNEDFDAGVAQAAISVGYFVSPEFEISIRQAGSFSDPGEGVSSTWNGSTRIGADFHFLLDNVLPFIGASFGYVYGDNIEESLAAGPEAGVKVFLQDRAFVFGSAEWLFLFDDDDSLSNAFDDGQVLYNVGFGLRF